MYLHSVQITNFRSIEDPGVVPLERVACLMGKNESGKTNFLEALVRLNPAPGQPESFDVDDDYPRRGAADIEHQLKDPDFPRPIVITARYRLSDADIADLHATFGEKTVTLGDDSTITVTVDYDRNRLIEFETNESEAVKHLAEQAGVEGDPAKLTTLAELQSWASATAEAQEEEEPASAARAGDAQRLGRRRPGDGGGGLVRGA